MIPRLGRSVLRASCFPFVSTRALSVHSVQMSQPLYETWSRRRLIRRIRELENGTAKTAEEVAKEDKAGAEEEPALAAGAGAELRSSAQESMDVDSEVQPKPKKQKKKREFDITKYHTRKIVLRFAYMGWNFNGLAHQDEPTPLPTVEGEIFDALAVCRLIPESKIPEEFEFSRCGRTDKGVSALNQSISLKVRSCLTPEEQADPANDDREINYVHILNNQLSKDIRILDICLRPPPDFDARFSCKHRHYKYLFHAGKETGLDVELMQEAASKFVGDHDFRNFCKLDGSKQIENFRRTILASSIESANPEDPTNNFYYFNLKGTAFLWHQVRCMVAILFLVGKKLEKPEIVDWLLDVENHPRKPVYNMAADIPLVLYDGVFEGLEWKYEGKGPAPDDLAYRSLDENLFSLWHTHELRAQIAKMLRQEFETRYKGAIQYQHTKPGRKEIYYGEGRVKSIWNYRNIENAQTMEEVEVRNRKYREKKSGVSNSK